MIGAGIWPLVDAAAMRELDRHTIETLAVPGEILMESAGRVVVEVVLHELGRLGVRTVVVICGAGNNGGDGLVVARHLHLAGVDARVRIIGDADRLTGDGGANLDRARRLGVPLEEATAPLPHAGVIVDALFGTGLGRDVEGAAAQAIQLVNAARDAAAGQIAVIAVDVPSGLSPDTGQPLGVAVRADRTVTIGLPKVGLTLEPGRSLAGRVDVARIGIADDAPGVPHRAEQWTRVGAGRKLPSRPPDGHKGTFGHVLIVAGSEGKTGAAALAASGAARGGAGLVTIACPAGLNDILEIKCTEMMTAPVADTADRALAAAAEDAILALAADRDVVAMGPGVGRSHETVALMRALAKRLEKPLVIDADGLFALSEAPGSLASREAPTILTPHPGEAATLLGCRAAEVNRDRLGAARSLSDQTGAVVLLKGAATIAADPTGRVIVNPTGGPALSAGGTGDVLVGLVASYLAQGLPALEAAALAAFVHGAAADALSAGASAGVIAGDIARAVPSAMEALRSEAGDPRAADAMTSGAGFAIPMHRA